MKALGLELVVVVAGPNNSQDGTRNGKFLSRHRNLKVQLKAIVESTLLFMRFKFNLYFSTACPIQLTIRDW